jgi:hypothetical protein
MAEDVIFNFIIDSIVIDNEGFRRSQTNLIAAKILKKCNVIKEKNKRNNVILKAGDGKLMITNGLSVREFEKRFKDKVKII